jgi:peptidoglycan/LPS O-acetylase OafA/YrhL
MPSRAKKHRHNNFDALRLLAACFVFFSHSFPLYGRPEPDFLSSPGLRSMNLGGIGVSMFFAISGYLVTQSWVRTEDPGRFFFKRILRLYPAFGLNFLVVAFLIAPLASTVSYFDYLAMLWQDGFSLLKGLVSFAMPHLPGAFQENPLRGTNSPLWTLRWEVLCYAFIFVMGLLDLKRLLGLMTVLYFLLFWEWMSFPEQMEHLGLLYAGGFLLGACCFVYRKYIRFSHQGALISLLVLALLGIGGIYCLLLYLAAVVYLTLYVALEFRPMGNVARYGDFSYGLYLYAWPIQQAVGVAFSFRKSDFALYVATSFLLSMMAAAFSWYGVERHVLKLSHMDRKKR